MIFYDYLHFIFPSTMFLNELIGQFDRYHFWLCIIIFASKFGIAFHHMAIIFLAPPVSYQCPGNETCCDNPTYDTSKFTRTIITEWHLICEKSWLKDLTQMLFQLGVLLGSLLFGMASDRWGRRPTLIAAVILEIITGTIPSFVPNYWAFTIIRMFLGFSVGGVMVVGFVIVMEYIGSTYRDIVSSLYQLPFTVGVMILSIFGYLLRDYMYFQLAIGLSNVFLLSYICILPETPRWYLAVDRTTEAVQIIQRVAKINKKPTEDIERKVEMYQQEHKNIKAEKSSVVDLFRTPNIRRNIIIMSFNWLVCSYCFYGVSQYISHLSGDIFIIVVANGFVCTLGVLVSIPCMKFAGRKTVSICNYIGCTICLVLVAAVPDGVVSIAFGCLGALFCFIVFVVMYPYCTEMFPTTVRNAALGICSMMARLGSMLAPFVAALRPHGLWCAPVTFGIFPLLAALACLWLPETKDCELMMTIEEGEALGNKRQTPPQEINIRN